MDCVAATLGYQTVLTYIATYILIDNVCIYTNVNFTQEANGCRTGCRSSNDLIVSEGSSYN